VIGLAALGGFGWVFYDFITHKAEYNTPLTQAELKKLTQDIPPKPNRTRTHLDDWKPNFDVTHMLNVTGYVKPEVTESETTTQAPPPPRFSPDDVTVSLIIANETNPGAYLIPSGAQAEGGLPPGDFYGVGDKIKIPAKQNAELEVAAIRDSEVEFSTLDGEDSFVVSLAADEVDASLMILAEEPEELTSRIVAPRTTRQVSSDEYEIGTDDLNELRDMPDDRIFSSVRVQPARNAVQQVRGLRITSIQEGTLFDRVGLRVDDVVLSVNGVPAVDRAELISKLRNSEPSTTVRVEIERRGGARTLVYRVPR